MDSNPPQKKPLIIIFEYFFGLNRDEKAAKEAFESIKDKMLNNEEETQDRAKSINDHINDIIDEPLKNNRCIFEFLKKIKKNSSLDQAEELLLVGGNDQEAANIAGILFNITFDGTDDVGKVLEYLNLARNSLTQLSFKKGEVSKKAAERIMFAVEENINKIKGNESLPESLKNELKILGNAISENNNSKTSDINQFPGLFANPIQVALEAKIKILNKDFEVIKSASTKILSSSNSGSLSLEELGTNINALTQNLNELNEISRKLNKLYTQSGSKNSLAENISDLDVSINTEKSKLEKLQEKSKNLQKMIDGFEIDDKVTRQGIEEQIYKLTNFNEEVTSDISDKKIERLNILNNELEKLTNKALESMDNPLGEILQYDSLNQKNNKRVFKIREDGSANNNRFGNALSKIHDALSSHKSNAKQVKEKLVNNFIFNEAISDEALKDKVDKLADVLISQFPENNSSKVSDIKAVIADESKISKITEAIDEVNAELLRIRISEADRLIAELKGVGDQLQVKAESKLQSQVKSIKDLLDRLNRIPINDKLKSKSDPVKKIEELKGFLADIEANLTKNKNFEVLKSQVEGAVKELDALGGNILKDGAATKIVSELSSIQEKMNLIDKNLDELRQDDSYKSLPEELKSSFDGMLDGFKEKNNALKDKIKELIQHSADSEKKLNDLNSELSKINKSSEPQSRQLEQIRDLKSTLDTIDVNKLAKDTRVKFEKSKSTIDSEIKVLEQCIAFGKMLDEISGEKDPKALIQKLKKLSELVLDLSNTNDPRIKDKLEDAKKRINVLSQKDNPSVKDLIDQLNAVLNSKSTTPKRRRASVRSLDVQKSPVRRRFSVGSPLDSNSKPLKIPEPTTKPVVDVKPTVVNSDLDVLPEQSKLEPQTPTLMQYMYARDLALRSEILNPISDLDVIVDKSGLDSLFKKLEEDNKRISELKQINDVNDYKTKFKIPESVNQKKLERLFKHEKEVFTNLADWQKSDDETIKSGTLSIKVSDASKIENDTKRISFVSEAKTPEEFKRDAFNMVRLATATKTKFKAVIRSTDPERILELYHQLSAAGIKPELSQDSQNAIKDTEQKTVIDKIAQHEPNVYRAYVQTMDIAEKLEKTQKNNLSETLKEEGIELPKGVGIDQLRDATKIIESLEKKSTATQKSVPDAPPLNNTQEKLSTQSPTQPISPENTQDDASFGAKKPTPK